LRGLAALALGTAALTTQPAFAGPPVQFKGLVSGTVTGSFPGPFTLNGSGIASHLGLVAHRGTVTITGTLPGGVITDTLTETFVAANGDTLTLLCLQIATPVGPGVFEATDQWTVIGGTGRFAGAKGLGTGDTYINLTPGNSTYIKQLTGSVTLRN
jgi:hypothetical protein